MSRLFDQIRSSTGASRFCHLPSPAITDRWPMDFRTFNVGAPPVRYRGISLGVISSLAPAGQEELPVTFRFRDENQP